MSESEREVLVKAGKNNLNSIGVLAVAVLLLGWSICAMNQYTEVVKDDQVDDALWVFSLLVGFAAIVYGCLLSYQGKLAQKKWHSIALMVFSLVLFVHLFIGTGAATSTGVLGKEWNDASLAFGIIGLLVSLVLAVISGVSFGKYEALTFGKLNLTPYV